MEDELALIWKTKDGWTFSKKEDAIAHAKELNPDYVPTEIEVRKKKKGED